MKQFKEREFRRQVEITAFVYEKSNNCSEDDLLEIFRISKSTLRRDFQKLKEMHIDIGTRKRQVNIVIRDKQIKDILAHYISISTKFNIRNFDQLKAKYNNKIMSLFVKVLKAIHERKYLKIDYAHTGEEIYKIRVVEPIYLNPTSKSYILIAYENGELRFFRLEGIENVSLISKEYNREVPTLDEIYHHSWGIYSGGKEIFAELRFSKSLEDYFRNRTLAEDQIIEFSQDGVYVSFKVKLAMEFIAWVMGWGEDVTILGPEELKKQIITKAKGLLEINRD